MARSTRRRRTEEEEPESRDVERDEDTEEDEDRESRRRRRSSEGSSRRRGGRDDDDDDRDEDRASPEGGWGEARRAREETRSSKFAEFWKPSDEATLVKFLDDEPFASYGLHWFDEITKGRKGYECIRTVEGESYGRKGECPACDLLDNDPKLNVLFNVVVFDTADPDSSSYGEFDVKVLKCGVTLTEQLQSLAEGDRTGPLSRHYWEITASGKGGSYSANCNMVKERDVEEDWEIEPLSAEDLEAARKKAYDSDLVKFPTVSELKKVVEGLL